MATDGDNTGDIQEVCAQGHELSTTMQVKPETTNVTSEQSLDNTQSIANHADVTQSSVTEPKATDKLHETTENVGKVRAENTTDETKQTESSEVDEGARNGGNVTVATEKNTEGTMKLKDNIQAVAEKISSTASEIKTEITEKAAAAKDKAEKTCQGIKEKIRETATALKDNVTEKVNDVKKATGLVGEDVDQMSDSNSNVISHDNHDNMVDDETATRVPAADGVKGQNEGSKEHSHERSKSRSKTPEKISTVAKKVKERSSPGKDKAIDTAKDTMKDKETAKKGAKVVSKSGGAGVVIEAGTTMHDINKAHNAKKSGDMTEAEFQEATAKKTGAAVGSATGMVVGATAGACVAGPPGAIVGGLAGQAAGRAVGAHAAEAGVEAKRVTKKHIAENKELTETVIKSGGAESS